MTKYKCIEVKTKKCLVEVLSENKFFAEKMIKEFCEEHGISKSEVYILPKIRGKK